MPRLTDQEKADILRLIEKDKPLPDHYRFLLFDDKREVELVWNGKTSDVCNVVLPFQTIESIDEPRIEGKSKVDQELAGGLFDSRGRQMQGWTNKLIWGDNKLILSSLKNGPLRDEIEKQGGLKLIYIDPPFDVGADFSMDIEVGDGGDTFTKRPNILEEIAYRAFELLNLGRYERQHYVGVNPNLREEEKQKQLDAKEAAFLELILRAYRAEKVTGYPAFDGKKAGRMVAVGPVNLPVTRLFVEEIIIQCRKKNITRVDILGFEFEMGLFPNVQNEAREKGVDLAMKYIPAEVFDKRAVEKNQVVFHDVSFIEARPIVKGNTVAVKLTDFSVFYSQDSIAAAEAALSEAKKGGSKIVVDRGQIVKVTKDAKGITKREVLTEKWTDWVDYWAVDFDYENKREIIRVPVDLDPEQQKQLPGMEKPQMALQSWEERWTGEYIFENEWQSFRTKKDRTLELTSAAKEIEPGKGGRRKIAVKVVDIFGNDTMTIVDVVVGEGKKAKK